jgi:hypothetical protein
MPRFSRFIPVMNQYPSYKSPGGPKGRYGLMRKMSPPPGFDHLTVPRVGSRLCSFTSQNSSVGVETRLLSGRRGVRFRVGVTYFVFQNLQKDPGTHSDLPPLLPCQVG